MTWNRSNNRDGTRTDVTVPHLHSYILLFSVFLFFLRGAGYILKINYNGSSLTSVTGLI